MDLGLCFSPRNWPMMHVLLFFLDGPWQSCLFFFIKSFQGFHKGMEHAEHVSFFTGVCSGNRAKGVVASKQCVH